MKEIRILALATALASMLAIGVSVSAQTQGQVMDEDSSTTTIIEQQTVTTAPAGQAVPPASMDTTPVGGPNVTDWVTDTPASRDERINDSDQSPYWAPKDWNYISEEGAAGGS